MDFYRAYVVTHSEAEARAAVERWRDFPVTTHPRPAVLVGPAHRPEEGFVDGSSKLAYIAGAIEGTTGVPEEPVRVLRRLGHPSPGRIAAPLLVMRAERAEAPFWTDRGQRPFSAWRLEAVGARGPIWVMDDVALASCWFPPLLELGAPRGPHDAVAGTLALDGVTLTFRFIGSRPSVMVSYEAHTLETPTAICVIAKGIRNPEIPLDAVVAGWVRRERSPSASRAP